MPLIISDQISIHRGPLYKYKSLDEANFDHTMEILRDNRIFCPTPRQLNDPEECRPALVIGDLSDREYKAKIEGWARRCIAHRDTQPTEAEIGNELAQLTPEKLAEMAGATAGLYHRAINEQYRILSMALSPLNGHLWSAYAADYTGVCIQLNITPLVAAAYHVKYSDDVPLLDLVDDNGFASLDMTALRKRKAWQPEGEVRFILREPPLTEDRPLVNQKLRLDPESLQAVMFGYRIAEDKKQQLMEVIRGRGVRMFIAGGPPFLDLTLRYIGHS